MEGKKGGKYSSQSVNIFLESESKDKKGRAWRVKALAHQTPEWRPFIFSQSSTTGHPSPSDLTSSFFSKPFLSSKYIILNSFWIIEMFKSTIIIFCIYWYWFQKKRSNKCVKKSVKNPNNAFWDVQNFGFFTQRRLMVAISEGKQYIFFIHFHFFLASIISF